MKKYLLSITIMILMVFAYSCKEDDTNDDDNSQTMSFSGILIDNQDKPVPFAEIQFYQEVFESGKAQPGLLNDKFLVKDTTNENGEFYVEIPDKDNIYVVILHPDFKSTKHKMSDIKGKDGELNLLKGDKEEDCSAVVKVSLYDKQENKVKDAYVKLLRDGKLITKAKTNEEGQFIFEQVCPGVYSIIAYVNDKAIEKSKINIESDNLYEFSMIPSDDDGKDDKECCEGIMNFYPLGEDGAVLNGAKIIIYKDGKAIADPVVKDGKAIASELCEGKYTVVIKAEGYEENEFNVELGCSQNKDIEKEMTKKKKEEEEDCCNSTFQIQLKDKDGKAVNGTVVLKKEGKENRDKNSENGYAKFEEVCKGKYTVVIESENHKRMEFTYEIDCDKNIEISKTLENKENEEECCEGIMYFYPLGEDGAVLNGAKIIIYKDGKAIADPVVKDGKAIASELCEGKYTVVIKAEGYEENEFNVELGCSQNKDIEKEMTKKKKEEEEDCCNSTFQIQLKDKDGKAVNGTVVLKKEGKENRDKNSENGYAKFEEVCKGKYTVVIESENHKRMEFTYEIDCDKNIEISKTLENKENEEECCDAAIKVIVRDLENKAIQDAEIELWLDGNIISEGISNDGGYYYANDLCKGKYTLLIKKDGYQAIETNWEIKECKNHQETFKLKK